MSEPIDMKDLHKRAATVVMTLRADSGFLFEAEARVSPDQWRRIQIILNELPIVETS